jgi:hypothetical protein
MGVSLGIFCEDFGVKRRGQALVLPTIYCLCGVGRSGPKVSEPHRAELATEGKDAESTEEFL